MCLLGEAAVQVESNVDLVRVEYTENTLPPLLQLGQRTEGMAGLLWV